MTRPPTASPAARYVSLGASACLLISLSAVAVAEAGAAVAATAVDVPTYTYVDLGVIGPNVESTSDAADVNSSGQIVGSSTSPGASSVGALWDQLRVREIGTATEAVDRTGGATAINDRGVAVGSGYFGDKYVPSRAYVYEDGVVKDLGTGLSRGSGSFANGINDAGQVVGSRYGAGNTPRRAVLWENGTIRDLGTLGGATTQRHYTESEANDINERGQIVGTALPSSGYPLHGFVWQEGAMRDLGTLGGYTEATVAEAINDEGDIVGMSQNADGKTHAFLWQNGRMRDLGILGRTFQWEGSVAYDINNDGVIVGHSKREGPGYGTDHAVVWYRDGVPRDLNDLTPNLPADRRLTFAFAANDDGVIVGRSCDLPVCDTGSSRGYMLVPDSATSSPGAGQAVSALQPTAASNGWGPAEENRSNGDHLPGDGEAITIGGTAYAGGLGVHADSSLTYDLAGRYTLFSALAGVDDEVDDHGSVVFEVYVDGALRLRSPVLTGASGAWPVNVPVTGARTLRLVVNDAGDNPYYDHADWADAKLTSGPSVRDHGVLLTDMSPTSATSGCGPIEIDRSNGNCWAGDGQPLMLDGRVYDRGIGAHSESSITYALDGSYTLFQAVVGVDDEVSHTGTVVFEVYADDVLRARSVLLTSESPAWHIGARVDGARTLRLVVKDGGDGVSWDHADWADARLS